MRRDAGKITRSFEAKHLPRDEKYETENDRDSLCTEVMEERIQDTENLKETAQLGSYSALPFGETHCVEMFLRPKFVKTVVKNEIRRGKIFHHFLPGSCF